MKKEQVKAEPKKIKVILTRDIRDAEIVNGKAVRVDRKAGTEIEIEEGSLEPHFYIACDSLAAKEIQEVMDHEAKRKAMDDEFNKMREERVREREKSLAAVQLIAEKRVALAKEELERQLAIARKLKGPEV